MAFRRRITDFDQIPDAVWESMARAADVADDLASRGQTLRLDVPAAGGRVLATVRDAHDGVVRELALTELLDLT